MSNDSAQGSAAAPTLHDSKIKKVTVFSQGAQVFRHATIPDLAPVAISQGAKNALLRSVQFTHLTQTEDVRPRRKALEEQEKELKLHITEVDDSIHIAEFSIEAYRKVLAKVVQPSVDHKKSTAFDYDDAKWAQFQKFASDGIREKTLELRKHQREKQKLTTKLNVVRQDIRNLGGSDQRVTTQDVAEVLLKVISPEPATLNLQLSYVVRAASWSPVYDLRIDSLKKEMTVTYNAMVQQSTGEEWEAVKLDLSTAKPHVGGDAPTFSPWRIRVPEPEQEFYAHRQELEGRHMQMQQQMMTNMMMQQMMPASASAAPGGAAPPSAPSRAPTVASANVKTQTTATTFSIGSLSNIASSNQSSKVTITQQVYPVHFRYSAVPKLDSHVYLKVKTVNTSAFPLLPGKASVFADNQLVSHTEMGNVAPEEEFWTFLGVEDDISCTRSLVHKKNLDVDGGLFSKAKRKVEYSYKFKVKNAKRSVEELVVWDQMPICEDKRIELKLTAPPQADEGKETGTHPFFKINEVQFIEWFVNLKPQEERTFDYVFIVEYPPEEIITM